MKVILLEKIANLGSVGDQVDVKPGYARNFLIPQEKAVMATTANIADFEARRADLEAKAAEVLAAAKKRGEGIEGKTVTITARASDEGKLFGSVGPREIAEAAVAQSIEIAKSEVDMPEGPIRQVGDEYVVHVQLHGDVQVTLNVKVEAE